MDRIEEHLTANPTHRLVIYYAGNGRLVFSLQELELEGEDDEGNTTFKVNIVHEVSAGTFQVCRLKMGIWLVQQRSVVSR